MVVLIACDELVRELMVTFELMMSLVWGGLVLGFY